MSGITLGTWKALFKQPKSNPESKNTFHTFWNLRAELGLSKNSEFKCSVGGRLMECHAMVRHVRQMALSTAQFTTTAHGHYPGSAHGSASGAAKRQGRRLRREGQGQNGIPTGGYADSVSPQQLRFPLRGVMRGNEWPTRSPCHWVTSGPSVPRKTGFVTFPRGGRNLEAVGQVQGAGRSCESVPSPGAVATLGLSPGNAQD